MSQISQKSISGITSITTPAGIDDVFTVHSGDTTERFRVDQSGNQNISGIVTATNFKTGSSNLHSTGLTVGDTFVHATGVNASSLDIDDFISVGSNIHFGNAGVVTATSFSGDGSNLTSLPAGLGTALSSTQTDPLNKLYYTNQVLGVGATITVDPPASASKAYTQYADIKVDSDADLIIAEGDDLIPDVLGLADFGTFGGGASAGRIRVNSITNAAANGATTIQNGVVISGMTTITGGLSIGGTITYEDVTNVDSVGLITARKGIISSGVVTATTFSGSGASLTNLPAAQLSGTAAAINGTNITNLNASNIASGTVPTARLGSGTASSSTFLRGDSTFQTVNTDLVSDTSPQLGGALDVNGHQILVGDGGPGNSDENICVGDGKDLKIYHDGNSVLYDNGTGDFNLFSNGGAIKLKKDTGENMIVANTDGAVEIYHDNEKRLYTDSDGVTIGQSAYAQLKIDGQVGDCILASSGAQIEFTRASSSNILCSNTNGYLNFFTSGQTTFPAMRIFTTPSVESGAKVGINTDTIGVDAQMYVASRPGQPGLYSSYGMRLNPNGDSNNRISNATGVYALSKGITADNNWYTVAIGRYHAATVTIRVGDASSKRSMFINYDLTAPNYGVAHYNIIANNGQWNTGSADFQISSSGSYDYALQVRHNSYYNTSNNSGVYMIFNVC